MLTAQTCIVSLSPWPCSSRLDLPSHLLFALFPSQTHLTLPLVLAKDANLDFWAGKLQMVELPAPPVRLSEDPTAYALDLQVHCRRAGEASPLHHPSRPLSSPPSLPAFHLTCFHPVHPLPLSCVAYPN